MALFSKSGSFEVMPNGFLLQTEFPAWNEVGAVNQDGVYFVIEGSKWTPAFRDPPGELARRGGWPQLDGAKINVVPMEELLAIYGSAAVSASGGGAQVDSAQAKLGKAMMDAAAARASDLKIIQDAARARIRIKVAGREFTAGLTMTSGEGTTAMSTVFDARDQGTGDATAVATKFQSFSVSPGSSSLRLPAGVVKLRGQRGFHEHDNGLGSHMVLRLFYSDAAQVETSTLDSLGFDREVSEALAGARAKLAGGVIVAGATGDGKSTTLVRCLQTLYEEHEKKISIVTIEDPVEYRILGDGIVQIPVKSAGTGEERTAAFRQALMHFVRINPDVGAISEVRDADAAKEVLQFIDTGHQVWTTIHGSTANGILFRLIEMGLPPEELCKPGSIELLMKQSLAPMLCRSCALPLDMNPSDPRERAILRELRRLAGGEPRGAARRNIDGCPNCRPKSGESVAAAAWTGYQRQIGVAEIIIPDEGYFDKVRRRDSFGARRHWLLPRSEGGLGGTPLDAKLARMALNGDLDPLDAVRKGADFAKIDPAHLPPAGTSGNGASG